MDKRIDRCASCHKTRKIVTKDGRCDSCAKGEKWFLEKTMPHFITRHNAHMESAFSLLKKNHPQLDIEKGLELLKRIRNR